MKAGLKIKTQSPSSSQISMAQTSINPPLQSVGSSVRSRSFMARCVKSIKRALSKNWICCRGAEPSKDQSQSRRRSTIQFTSSSSSGKYYSQKSSNEREEMIKEAIIYCKATMEKGSTSLATVAERPIDRRSSEADVVPVNRIGLPRQSLLMAAPAKDGKEGKRIRGLAISCSKVGEGGRGLTYKDAGVDIDAGTELVRRIAKMAPGIGGFGGLFPLGISLSSVLARI